MKFMFGGAVYKYTGNHEDGLSGRIKNKFKYHVSCTDEKISVRINLFFITFSPSSLSLVAFLFPVGLSP